MADWIRKQLNKGYDPRQIKEELQSEGYTVSKINSAFDEINRNSLRRNKTEESSNQEKNEESGIVNLPEDVPVVKIGAGVFLLIALIAIGTLVMTVNDRDLGPPSQVLDGVNGNKISNHSAFYVSNEEMLIMRDREITSEMTISARDRDMGASTIRTVTQIEEGGNKVLINSEGLGNLTQDFEEERFVQKRRVWTKRTNLDSQNRNSMHTTRSKGQRLDGVEFAGIPFNYIIFGNYDEITTRGNKYILKAAEGRSRNPRIINYTAEMTVKPSGLITSAKARMVRDEDSVITVREINYEVKNKGVSFERPSWIAEENIREAE